MTKFKFRLILLLAFCSVLPAHASRELDKIYSMRTFVAMVLSPEKNPVYAEHLENESVRFFRSQPRYDYSDEGYVWLKDRVKNANFDAKAPLTEQVQALKSLVTEMGPIGVDAVNFIEIVSVGERYKIVQVVVSTNSLEFLETTENFVEDRMALSSFTDAMREGRTEILSRIPFDGSVLKRDGFRVVLDRGTPDLQPNTKISIYTLEPFENKLILDETGIVEITEVGESYAFGKIIVENKPNEVETSNKILLTPRENTRSPQAMESEVPRATTVSRQFGYFELQGTGSLVTVNNGGPNGGATKSNAFYPGGSLRGELWLSNRVNLDFGFNFGMSSFSPDGSESPLNSSIGDIRAQLSYRFRVSDTVRGPFLELKAGYLRHQFQVDSSADPLGFVSATYSGPFFGGGAGIPLFANFGIGVNVNALVFGSRDEDPSTSGTARNISGWDFAMRAYYHLNEAMDILAKVHFEAFGADFASNGTRAIPIASSSESSKSVSLGVSFFF